MPDNFITMAFALVLPKLMSNSLLALLNSRDTLREMHAGQVVSVHLSKITGGIDHPGPSDSTRQVHAHGKDAENQEIIELSPAARISDDSLDSEFQVPRDTAI
ncbi:uncharacterized protein PHACADRAFT_210800 [Phanerochaete carnosa HHB-10118-sp]|uniref:Uncharacterized protein n=1 Tax=Phanerochaete carnosa (strain HHB-10118-sp) TaxID=650164 RepID=K5UT00_PHACS|nr:uncharacterized protein PHACADRAFT_210800 [Phanerochaete carnosa HHB-10118-sp]EKM53081.1 hypothetical protein PHACADRAFT_210800 [Phanerochaete carnosa HHB-10118-sp]